MPMIQDDELRELFQTECEEHLQTLDDGLLRLETNPLDQPTLEEVFRAAHSLKGTARMLGVSGVETIAHHMEDELGSLKRGRGALNSNGIDRYSIGLRAMRLLVQEAVDDTPAHVDLNRVLSQLSGEISLEVAPLAAPVEAIAVESVPVPLRAFPIETVPVEAIPVQTAPVSPQPLAPQPLVAQPLVAQPLAPQPLVAQPLAAELLGASIAMTAQAPIMLPVSVLPELPCSATSEKSALLQSQQSAVVSPTEPDEGASEIAGDARPSDFKIQTMRVPPAKLDALMTLASELTVTTTRVIRGLSAFEDIGALCEEWSKDLSGQRTGGDPARQLSRDQARLARLKGLWDQLKATTYQDVTRLDFVADELEEGIRGVRLLPLSQIFNLFPRLVRDLARELGKEISFSIEGGDTAADKRILEELKDPLMHMIRNAVDHGIESPAEREQSGKARAASIRLRAHQSAGHVWVELRDDGRGLNGAAIKSTALKRRLHSEEELAAMSREQLHLLIFAPGFSTSALVTDVSGRGVGMDVARINIERLKGTIRVQSEPGQGTTFLIRLPSTLATTRVLLVTVGGRPYAIPVEWVQTIARIGREQIFSIEGRQTVVFDERALPLVQLSSLLELPSRAAKESEITVVLEVDDERFGVQVDGLVDEQEVVLKPLGGLLKRVRGVSGVTILGAGEICMVLNPHDLAKAALHSAPRQPALAAPDEAATVRRKVILLAEDSITTRTQEKRILEGAGFEVVTAVDGADAFDKLSTRDFDAVVSDVEMPNMTGLTLAARIRENSRYDEMPIVLVTSLASDDDKRRGMEAGANAYITKGSFEQKVLVETVRRLV